MIATILTCGALRAPAAEYVVDAGGGTGHTTIQSALDVAVAGDYVTVNPGTYVENLTMTGGVVLQSASGADFTTIDGDGDICINCVQCASGTVITGFTLTGGGGYTGGGVRVFDLSNVEIHDNVFVDNQTTYEGAGITVQRFSHASIHDNRFLNNVSFRTAAITVIVNSTADIVRNFFKGNRSADFAACIGVDDATVEVAWNLFVENHSLSYGGTVDFDNSGNVMYNNTFLRNQAPGGASCVRSNGVNTITNNLFAHNGTNAVVLYDCGAVSCNFFYDNGVNSAGPCDPIGTNNNQVINPMVCDPSMDDGAVSEYSPCLIGPCGLVGANDEPACRDDVVPNTEVSWGSAKAMFR